MLKIEYSAGSEPFIRAAIILPEDRARKIELEFPDPETYSLKINGRYASVKLGKILQITQRGKYLSFGHESSGSIRNISIQPREESHSAFRVREVPAGRGFHWQKKIKVSLAGSGDFQVKNGFLLMVNELPLETYLKCVAASEMSTSCPPALLEAQTIVARSWILANAEHKHNQYNAHVCNDDCCQRYQGIGNLSKEYLKRTDPTRGQVLTFQNQICDTRYSKSCGGKTESSKNVWGVYKPYLISQPDLDVPRDFSDLSIEAQFLTWLNTPLEAFCGPGFVPEADLPDYLGNVDKKGHYFRWEVSYSYSELESLISRKLDLKISRIEKLLPLKRGDSGRLIKLEIKYKDNLGKLQKIKLKSEYEIRRVLHASFLYSSAFAVINSKDRIILRGAGWGHGAGLCQIGALGMALKKYGTGDILKHYFPGTELKKIYK